MKRIIRKRWKQWAFIGMALIGLCLIAYPFVSDLYNRCVQSRVITNYENLVDVTTTEAIEEELSAAAEYNAALAALNYNTAGDSDLQSDLLDVTGDGVIAYVTIPAINQELAIYKSSIDESVLNMSAQLLSGSSLPVGGEGTHSVIYAHRGLQSAELFSNLDKLELGDTFSVTVLSEVLVYEVDQICVVEPDDPSALTIVDGEDYCTLLTCTPYGKNTHRLLVRGTRVESGEVEQLIPWRKTICFALIALLLVIAVAFWINRKKKQERRAREYREYKFKQNLQVGQIGPGANARLLSYDIPVRNRARERKYLL